MKWIECAERLPENDQRVMFSEGNMVWAGYYENGHFWDYCSGEGGEQGPTIVWAEWPVAPKSREEIDV